MAGCSIALVTTCGGGGAPGGAAAFAALHAAHTAAAIAQLSLSVPHDVKLRVRQRARGARVSALRVAQTRAVSRYWATH